MNAFASKRFASYSSEIWMLFDGTCGLNKTNRFLDLEAPLNAVVDELKFQLCTEQISFAETNVYRDWYIIF